MRQNHKNPPENPHYLVSTLIGAHLILLRLLWGNGGNRTHDWGFCSRFQVADSLSKILENTHRIVSVYLAFLGSWTPSLFEDLW